MGPLVIFFPLFLISFLLLIFFPLSPSFYPSVSLHLSLRSHNSLSPFPTPSLFSSLFSSLSPCHSSGCTKQGLGVIEVLTWEFFRRGLLSSAVPQRDLSFLGFTSMLSLASPRAPHGNSLSSRFHALSPVASVPFPDRCVVWLIEFSACQSEAWLFILFIYFFKKVVLPATIYQNLGSLWEGLSYSLSPSSSHLPSGT